MKKTAIITIALISAAVCLYAAPGPRIVDGTQVNFRQEPGASGRVIGKLNRPQRSGLRRMR
jgi:hypothetical protein